MEWPPLRVDWLFIAAGLVLLLNPVYVGALALDEPNWYRYESYQVVFTDDGIEYPDGIAGSGDFDSDVACLNSNHRVCRLEYHVFRNGGIAHPDRMAAGPGRGYRYAYLNDSFYQVVPQTLGGSGTLGHEKLPRAEALGYVATPLEEASPAIRDAVKTGAVETHRRLQGADELVRMEGNYYVVGRVASHTYHSSAYDRKKLEGRIIEGGLMVAGIALGLWFVLRGQRHRVLRQVRTARERRA